MSTGKARNKRWTKAGLGTIVVFVIMVIVGWLIAFGMTLLDKIIDI